MVSLPERVLVPYRLPLFKADRPNVFPDYSALVLDQDMEYAWVDGIFTAISCKFNPLVDPLFAKLGYPPKLIVFAQFGEFYNGPDFNGYTESFILLPWRKPLFVPELPPLFFSSRYSEKFSTCNARSAQKFLYCNP